MKQVVKYYYSEPLYMVNTITNGIECAVNKVEICKRYTMAAVYDDARQTISFGLAICQPQDNFCKQTGREIALKNAKNHPFYVITDFTGRRNDFADEVMWIMKQKEIELHKKNYPLYISNKIKE